MPLQKNRKLKNCVTFCPRTLATTILAAAVFLFLLLFYFVLFAARNAAAVAPPTAGPAVTTPGLNDTPKYRCSGILRVDRRGPDGRGNLARPPTDFPPSEASFTVNVADVEHGVQAPEHVARPRPATA